MKEAKEDVYFRLRRTEKEFGREALKNAVLISNIEFTESAGGVDHVFCPTASNPILGNVDWKVARFFEDL